MLSDHDTDGAGLEAGAGDAMPMGPGATPDTGTNPNTETGPAAELPDALVAALAEIERHVGVLGWDQPARLFALVRTDELVRAEPALAAHLVPGAPDSLSSIEQEDFREGDDLQATLESMQWSPAVSGVALVLERSFLPAQAEADLPDDPAEAADAVAAHPAHQDMRVVVGVLRDGATHGLARLRERPDELLGGPQLAPGLAEVLKGTLE